MKQAILIILRHFIIHALRMLC